jgi:hypothetical protein
MEQYTGSISLLLQHGQRFFEIWNFQIIIAVAWISPRMRAAWGP